MNVNTPGLKEAVALHNSGAQEAAAIEAAGRIVTALIGAGAFDSYVRNNSTNEAAEKAGDLARIVKDRIRGSGE